MAPKKLPPHLSEKKFANEDLEEPESPLLCGYDSHESRSRGCLGRLSRRTCYTLGALGMVLAIAVSVVAGYLIGTKVFSANLKVAEGTVVKYGLPMPAGTKQVNWIHDLTFSQRPTPESEKAWADLIPNGRGFVFHEELAPNVANVALYHQLHCLHAILVGYWSAMDAAANGTSPKKDHVHLPHCFDYLKQTLLCSADTNLEEVDELHIADGWGWKQCRDADAVFRWAEEHRNSDGLGIQDGDASLASEYNITMDEMNMKK